MQWRELQKNDTELLTIAAGFDRSYPAFYQDMANSRIATIEDMLRCYEQCAHLYGLFIENELVGLIYLDALNPNTMEVHLDLKRGTDPLPILPCIAEIRDLRIANGMTLAISWTIRQHRNLRKLLQQVGFKISGLEMKRGSAHSRVLQWVQLVLTSETAQEIGR